MLIFHLKVTSTCDDLFTSSWWAGTAGERWKAFRKSWKPQWVWWMQQFLERCWLHFISPLFCFIVWLLLFLCLKSYFIYIFRVHCFLRVSWCVGSNIFSLFLCTALWSTVIVLKCFTNKAAVVTNVSASTCQLSDCHHYNCYNCNSSIQIDLQLRYILFFLHETKSACSGDMTSHLHKFLRLQLHLNLETVQTQTHSTGEKKVSTASILLSHVSIGDFKNAADDIKSWMHSNMCGPFLFF